MAVDLEATNLLPFVDKIHCVCVLDCATGLVTTHTERDTLIQDSKDWGIVIGHGILMYDMWTLWKLWGIPFNVGPDSFNNRQVEYFDTLVASRTLHPDRPFGHSLASWGEHLGIPKFDHTDFSQYTEQMRVYCEQDARICAAIYKELLKEMNK